MIRLRVNGVEQSFDGDPQMPLLWYLRDGLGLMGTKFGCGMGLCGACTVNQGGKVIRSCLTAMSSTAGTEITTIEGLGGGASIQSKRRGCGSTFLSAVTASPAR
jgi:isoquinoline 1-oxidoreductase alpha subunit